MIEQHRPSPDLSQTNHSLARIILFSFLLTFILARVVVCLIMSHRLPDLDLYVGGTLSLLSDPSQAGGVAWWAHIGGFVYGALLCSVIKVKRFYRRRYEDEDMPW
jgi:membrane associated rhomboid family serine protease